MPKFHVLDAPGGNPVNTTAVAHVAMPTGNNDAGTSWQTCYLASFGASSPATRLMVGNGPGKISQQEATDISQGNLIEIPFIFSDSPLAPLADRQALLTTLGQRAIDEYQALFFARFKLYGYTQAA